MRSGLVRIASYANPAEAEMACEFLNASGIVAEIENESGMSTFGAGSVLATPWLLVEMASAVDAKRLLVEFARVQSPEQNLEVVRGDESEPRARFDGYFESTWNEREKAAESAYRGAVLGWFLPFASWWAAWKLCQVAGMKLPLNDRCARRAKIAFAAMLLPALAWAAFIGMLLSPR